jgi:hypothetical protein
LGPIANDQDAIMQLTLREGKTTPAVCTLAQSVSVAPAGTVLYAELIWLDRPTSKGANGEGQVQMSLRDKDGALTEFYSEDRLHLNTRDKRIYKHIATVTDYVRENREFSVEFTATALLTPFDEQWDNVQLTVCMSVAEGGDPHFTTWKGEKFSYHGACDLVLLHSDKFGDGLGMDVHIRTKHRRNFSYISNLALRLGDEVFEVAGKGQYYLNGIENAPLSNTISGYEIVQSVNSKTGYPMYTVYVSDNERVIIKTWKDIVSISFEGEADDNFGDAVGLMGNYHTGKKLGRDGRTVFHQNYNAFGQEWQVLASEPYLFQTLEQAQAYCTLPDENESDKLFKRRRLGESISETDAKKACTHVGAEDMDFCVFDVMSTSDIDIAGTY